MIALLQNIVDLKTKAKNERDSGLYRDATRTLMEAVNQLDSAWKSTSVVEAKAPLAVHLADCHGMIGGVQLRWGLHPNCKAAQCQHLERAVKAYDEGYKYESAKENLQANSYNLVNRIVARILYEKYCPSGPIKATPSLDMTTIDMRKELEKAENVIRRQLRIERRGDVWALADLALVNLLLDKQKPISAYYSFNKESPPDYVYVSALSTLKMLADVDPPLPIAANLHEAIDHLEDNLKRINLH